MKDFFHLGRDAGSMQKGYVVVLVESCLFLVHPFLLDKKNLGGTESTTSVGFQNNSFSNDAVLYDFAHHSSCYETWHWQMMIHRWIETAPKFNMEPRPWSGVNKLAILGASSNANIW